MSGSVQLRKLVRGLFNGSRTTYKRLVIPAFARPLSTGGDQQEPPLPEYVEREGESLDIQRARLLYQSRKRGMLENGLLLSTFAASHLNQMNENQIKQYDTLINKPSNDWDLYYWATGNQPTPREYDNEVMNMLKKHAQNENKENRSRQPDLY